jgi:hypothetical protein
VPTIDPSVIQVPPAGVEVRWEEATRPAAGGSSTIEAMVRGDEAWVGVSDCIPGECRGVDAGVAVWTSSDGRTWSGNELTADSGDRIAQHLAVGAAGYLLATEEVNRGFPRPTYRLWSSANGRTWHAIGEIPRDGCTRKFCPSLWSLALAPSGTILAHASDHLEDESFGPFASEDGVDWRVVDPGAFGLDALVVESIQSTDAAVLLVGRSCWDCEPRLWTSTDGATWDSIDEVSVLPSSFPRLATGDGQRVIVLNTCPEAQPCGTEVWSSVDGGRWTRRITYPHVLSAEVTFAGSAFVAVGLDEGCRYEPGDDVCNRHIELARYVVLASPDGVTWGEIPLDDTMNPVDEECWPAWIAGADDTMVLGGHFDCIFWRGTVTVP